MPSVTQLPTPAQCHTFSEDRSPAYLLSVSQRLSPASAFYDYNIYVTGNRSFGVVGDIAGKRTIDFLGRYAGAAPYGSRSTIAGTAHIGFVGLHAGASTLGYGKQITDAALFGFTSTIAGN